MKRYAIMWCIGLVLLVVEGCLSHTQKGLSGVELKDPRLAEPFDVVDCLLPGQIRQLGARVTYVTERRPIRTTAEDCAIRGGEYVALDRADYGTALKIWMGAAEGGDPDAQYYVGVLYEKGAEGQPNYTKAASWYQHAAERNVRRAAINLGRLYEQGLGVEKSAVNAATWFGKASGSSDGRADDSLTQLELLEREVGEVRSRLGERLSLLDDERRRLAQVKTRLSGAEPIDRQERAVTEREHEVTKLQTYLTSLKDKVRQQEGLVKDGGGNRPGHRGPSIRLIDPPLFITRGIRIEQERVSVSLTASRPRRLTGRVTAPVGLRKLTVNGTPTTADDQGTFIIPVPEERSPSRGIPIDIEAADQEGDRATLKLVVTGGLPKGIEPEVFPNRMSVGRYHALVIGNDRYRRWAPLSTAVADANSVADVLKNRYGFEVKTLKDASRTETLKALNEYRNVLSERDNLLVYYAGHGFLEPQIDRGYWIPIEGDPFDNSEWIEFPKITDLLELIKAKQVLIVADSCFAGKLTRSAMTRMRADGVGEAREAVLQQLTDKRTRTALTSGGAKPVLDEGGGEGHSIFATAFLDVLTENNVPLETEQLFWTVRSRVIQAAEQMKFEQVPTYGPIHMAGHEGFGDFVFIPLPSRANPR